MNKLVISIVIVLCCITFINGTIYKCTCVCCTGKNCNPVTQDPFQIDSCPTDSCENDCLVKYSAVCPPAGTPGFLSGICGSSSSNGYILYPKTNMILATLFLLITWLAKSF